MDTRQSLDARAVGLMLVLCLIWSMQQILLKATQADMAPVLQIAIRSGAGVLLVGLVMLSRHERLTVADGIWKPGVVTGVLFGLEFVMVGQGLQYTSAAHSIVFLYTAPIFAALGLQWKLPSERLAPMQWLGILLAFSGIAVAFLLRGPSALGPDMPNMLLGDFLALMGGLAWGATTVVVRTTRLAALPPTQPLQYQLLGGLVILPGAAMLLGQTTFTLTPMLWGSLLFQSLMVSFVSYLAWYWLLSKYLASPLGVFSFLTPIIGVILGAWLLSEPIEPAFLAGALLVLGGVVLVSGYGWWLQVMRRV
ncbi:EamA family transporter [Pusillimonas sp. TS35]|uniref:DMT family transporter n=1 Tax=Paracandidimonas lactea TaxID=2895524 RepID=UPI00136C83F7|nr:EamA family transporter [Pusillimonas sp. TS35]